jgi:hypothetical protein
LTSWVIERRNDFGAGRKCRLSSSSESRELQLHW